METPAPPTESPAATTERWLSVSQLTEFVFCPRAGVLATEAQVNDEDEPERLNLDFSLPYTLEDLDRALDRNLNRLWVLTGIGICILAVILVGLWFHQNVLLLLSAAGVLALAQPLSRRVRRVLELIEQRGDIRSRPRRDVALDANHSQDVDWWDLLNSDWISIRPQEPYRDEALRLAGRPWRVLRKGSTVIPVFKLPPAQEGEPFAIFPKHRVRMAAYCRLIAACEGGESPFAIALLPHSYRGVTIPTTPESPDLLTAQLQGARTTFTAAILENVDPPAAPRECCAGCPWGLPRPLVEGVTDISRDGDAVSVFGVPKNGQLYHSPCGDRFAWTPPHAAASRLGLV